MENIGTRLKEIRLQNNLTQKEFAKLFYLTESAINNYEKGIRGPNLEFIKNVCEKFNLSLDFFDTNNFENSKFADFSKKLEIVTNKGKKAIFDKSEAKFITKFLYDKIILTRSGNHIILNSTSYTSINGDKHERITYSAIINNNGEIFEYDNLEFDPFVCDNPETFFYKDKCPAYNKLTKKFHLVNTKGELLSKGYDKIKPISEFNLGLWLAYDFNNTQIGANKDIINFAILNKQGKELDFEYDFHLPNKAYFPGQQTTLKENHLLLIEIKGFSNLNVLLESMKKEGVELLSFALIDIFELDDNCFKILKTIIEYNDNSEDEEKILKLAYLLSLLEKNIKLINLNFLNKKLDLKFNFKDKSYENGAKKMIDNFFNELGFSNIEIKQEDKLKNLDNYCRFLWKDKNKFYFEKNSKNNFSNVLFYSKDIVDKSYTILLKNFEQYILDFCEVCGKINNKPSIMLLQNFIEPEKILEKLGKEYFDILDDKDINVLNEKSSVYMSFNPNGEEDYNSLIKNIIESRSNIIPKNELVVIIGGLERANIKDMDLFLALAKSRNIHFILLLEEDLAGETWRSQENMLKAIKLYSAIEYSLFDEAIRISKENKNFWIELCELD